MNQNNNNFDAKKYLDNLQKKQANARLKESQKKEILKQKILHDWSQQGSVFFWGSVFQQVDFETLQMVYENIVEMVAGGKRVNNPAAMMVRILQNMGKIQRKGGTPDGK